MTFFDNDLEEIKQKALSVLKSLDNELQRHVDDLKFTLHGFPGLKIIKSNLGKDKWSITIAARGDDGVQSMRRIMALFEQNQDLEVSVVPEEQENVYVLSGQDPEVVSLWLKSILRDHLPSQNRTLH